MPFGPKILCPEKVKKSQPSAWTSMVLMVHGLGAIDQGGDVGGAGARADLLHWQQQAGNVGGVAEGDEFGAWVE